jgi:hypothetical protein
MASLSAFINPSAWDWVGGALNGSSSSGSSSFQLPTEAALRAAAATHHTEAHNQHAFQQAADSDARAAPSALSSDARGLSLPPPPAAFESTEAAAAAGFATGLAAGMAAGIAAWEAAIAEASVRQQQFAIQHPKLTPAAPQGQHVSASAVVPPSALPVEAAASAPWAPFSVVPAVLAPSTPVEGP